VSPCAKSASAPIHPRKAIQPFLEAAKLCPQLLGPCQQLLAAMGHLSLLPSCMSPVIPVGQRFEPGESVLGFNLVAQGSDEFGVVGVLTGRLLTLMLEGSDQADDAEPGEESGQRVVGKVVGLRKEGVDEKAGNDDSAAGEEYSSGRIHVLYWLMGWRDAGPHWHTRDSAVFNRPGALFSEIFVDTTQGPNRNALANAANPIFVCAIRMRLLTSICPLWSFDQRNWPEFIGSATLVQFGEAHFLLSCAHVSDNAAGREIYFPGSNGLSRLSGSGRITNPPPGRSRDADRGDVIFLKLTNDTADAMRHFYEFATADKMAVGSAAVSTNYTFAGYPEHLSRPRGRNVLRPEVSALTAGAWSQEDSDALALSPLTHVGIRLGGTPLLDARGRQTNMPQYNGISGGAVIAFAHEHAADRSVEPKLVGLCMECPPERPNVMLGVRLVAALDGIRARHPELASVIPSDSSVEAVWERQQGVPGQSAQSDN
jgi:hypothetical protein